MLEKQHEIDFKTACIDHILMHHPKILVTPQNAFNTKEALQRIFKTTVGNVKRFEEKQLVNVV